MEGSNNNIETVVNSLMKSIDGVLTSKTVIGEPIEIGDTILIPLSEVTVGAGAGANNSSKKDAGAGAFSAKMTPSAVLVIHNGNTKVVSIKDQNSVSRFVDLVPEVVDKFVALRQDKDMMDDEDAIDAAFPEEDSTEE